jgi:hypothetical protein
MQPITEFASQRRMNGDEAEPVLMFRFPTSDRYFDVPDSFNLTYKGKTFHRTGQHWLGSMGGGTTYASRLSADDRFVAVNSWSGVALPGAPLGEWVITGQFSGLAPQQFVERSFWLGKRYFVLPLETDMTKLMFCDVTALGQ